MKFLREEIKDTAEKSAIEDPSIRGQTNHILNSIDLHPSNSPTPVILYDHPLQRLLPPHVAVKLDRSAVAKICHYCFEVRAHHS